MCMCEEVIALLVAYFLISVTILSSVDFLPRTVRSMTNKNTHLIHKHSHLCFTCIKFCYVICTHLHTDTQTHRHTCESSRHLPSHVWRVSEHKSVHSWKSSSCFSVTTGTPWSVSALHWSLGWRESHINLPLFWPTYCVWITLSFWAVLCFTDKCSYFCQSYLYQ